MEPKRRLFAVIPAAGLSRRMGRPKLLLPLGESTIIARVLAVLDRPAIAERFVVVHPDDEPLRAAVAEAGAHVVQPPSPPPHMRDSVECALAEIHRRYQPAPDDGWLLTPADHPMLASQVLAVLIRQWQQTAHDMLVPTFGGRRGHPTIFRWQLADEVAAIPQDRGLNWLLSARESEVREVPVDDPAVLTDLDTPEDYAALLERWSGR